MNNLIEMTTPSELEIRLSREFAASREQVYAAFPSGMRQGLTAAYNALELLLKQLP